MKVNPTFILAFSFLTACGKGTKFLPGYEPPKPPPTPVVKEEPKPSVMPVPPTPEKAPLSLASRLCRMEEEYLSHFARSKVHDSPLAIFGIINANNALKKMSNEGLYPIYNWEKLTENKDSFKRRLEYRIEDLSTFGPCEEAAKQYRRIYAVLLGDLSL